VSSSDEATTKKENASEPHQKESWHRAIVMEKREIKITERNWMEKKVVGIRWQRKFHAGGKQAKYWGSTLSAKFNVQTRKTAARTKGDDD